MPDGSNAPVSGAPVVPVTPTAPAAGPAGPGTAAGVTADQVVSDARKYLGVPYVWGGTDPAKGLDCSGLVQRVYADLGIDLPRVSQDQARVGTAVPSLAQARPGDLVCFGTPADHIGIYIGDHKMIVAPKAGDVVKVQDVYRTPSTIRRVLPESAPAMDVAARRRPPRRAAAGGGVRSARRPPPPRTGACSRTPAGGTACAPGLLAAVAKVESRLLPDRGQRRGRPRPDAADAGQPLAVSASTRWTRPRPSTAPRGCWPSTCAPSARCRWRSRPTTPVPAR